MKNKETKTSSCSIYATMWFIALIVIVVFHQNNHFMIIDALTTNIITWISIAVSTAMYFVVGVMNNCD